MINQISTLNLQLYYTDSDFIENNDCYDDGAK